MNVQDMFTEAEGLQVECIEEAIYQLDKPAA
jgi:hypothetical protein